MTIDLADIHIGWLLRFIPETQDASELVAHLRHNGKITPELKTLIADILERKIKARVKRKRITDVLSKTLVKGIITYYKSILKSEDLKTWEPLKIDLLRAGYTGGFYTKKDWTEAAKFMACYQFGLTSAQLSEFLSPRAARAKRN